MQQDQDPLSALQPLHAPPPIPWWPPAPGWWLLALLLMMLIGLGWWLYGKGRLRRAALRELKMIESQADAPRQVALLNQLLKRYALACYPSMEVASLSGEPWLAFLDAHGGKGEFSKGRGELLASQPYSGDAPSLDGVLKLARSWIKANRPGRRR